jgi:nicotinamidase-related amidase
MANELIPIPLTARTVHLCVDMQRIFSTQGPWPTPWMERVLPVVVVADLAGRHPDRTVFTRFITPRRPDDMPGMWQRYYTRWRGATRECLDPELLELLPPLARLCPPAVVIDKST